MHISTSKSDVSIPRYLGGVLDFTGELNRYAVACATRRDAAAVARCRAIVDALMGQFLQFGGCLIEWLDTLLPLHLELPVFQRHAANAYIVVASSP